MDERLRWAFRWLVRESNPGSGSLMWESGTLTTRPSHFYRGISCGSGATTLCTHGPPRHLNTRLLIKTKTDFSLRLNSLDARAYIIQSVLALRNGSSLRMKYTCVRGSTSQHNTCTLCGTIRIIKLRLIDRVRMVTLMDFFLSICCCVRLITPRILLIWRATLIMIRILQGIITHRGKRPVRNCLILNSKFSVLNLQ